MAARTITGTIESIKVEENKTIGSTSCGTTYHPVVAEITLELEDGTKAYVKTQVGEKAYRWGDLMGGEHFHVARAQETASWPMVVQTKVQILQPTEGSIFKGTAFYPYSHWIPTLWAGDRITIRGSVEEHQSKWGVKYLTVKRVTVQNVEKEW